MQDKLINLTGYRFGKLDVRGRAPTRVSPNGTKHTLWECQCRCGETVIVKSTDLRRLDGKAIRSCRSCGATKHGHTRPGWQSLTYVSWHSMRTRCQRRHDYTSRGITVCERWNEFANFLADMGVRPSKKHSLDRIDNNKGYEPGNCRWATAEQQMRNTSKNVWLTIDGRTMILMDWLRTLGIATGTYYSRIKRGMSQLDAILTPVFPSRPKSPEHRRKMSESRPKKLTHKQRLAIQSRRALGESYRTIAKDFGVSESTVARSCGATY